MKNCYVTQYKMSADNDNLPYFNSVKIKIAQDALETNRIALNASSPCRVFAVGNCTMYVGQTAIAGNDTEIIEGDIYIKNKQEDIILNIIGRSTFTVFLAYFADLTGMSIDNFKQEYIPGLTQLQVGNVTGNINSLNHNLQLIALAFANSPLLEGDEKGLFSSLRENGKTSGKITYYSSNCPKLTNRITSIGSDYANRGDIHFMEDSVTYPNGWVVKIPSTGKWYDSNGNEISAPEL